MEIRQRKAHGLHDENEPLVPKTSNDSITKALIRRLESLVWISIAIAIGYFTNLLETVRGVAYGWSFYIAITCSFCFISIFLFVMYIKPFFTGKPVDLSLWEIENPKAIYLATFLGLVAYLSTVSMLWPVYHLFSFPIVFLELAGTIAFIGLF